MNKKILNYQFSIIGEFRDFYENIGSFIEEFKDFKKEILKDVMPTGQEFSCYKFEDKEVSILVHLNRIDFCLNELLENDCDKIKKYFDLFLGKIRTVNRLAINYNYLYEDKDSKILKKVSSNSLFSKEKNIKEFFIRKNNIFEKDGIEFNDIIIIQNGTYQNKDTFELIDSVIFQYDINTANGKRIDIVIEKDKINDIFNLILNRLIKEDKEIDAFIDGEYDE